MRAQLLLRIEQPRLRSDSWHDEVASFIHEAPVEMLIEVESIAIAAIHPPMEDVRAA